MTFPLSRLPKLAFQAVLIGVSTAILSVGLVVASLFTRSGAPGLAVARLWGRIAAKILGVSASLEGGEKAVPGKSYIVTPNHQSHSDILALLLTLPVRFRWVVKKELLRIPFFGWALAATGAVSIDRSKKQEALKRLNEGQSKLADGWSVLIYPEGTRSPDGNLQPLRKGAFLMAVNTGVPILPVTVNGAHKVIPKKTLNVTPGHVTVTIGDPIETEGLTEDDVQALSDKTRDAILKNFNPDYDPFGPNSAAVLQ